MKKRILLILFVITMFMVAITYSICDDKTDENTVSEDFKLTGDIEVDAVSTATMST